MPFQIIRNDIAKVKADAMAWILSQMILRSPTL